MTELIFAYILEILKIEIWKTFLNVSKRIDQYVAKRLETFFGPYKNFEEVRQFE